MLCPEAVFEADRLPPFVDDPAPPGSGGGVSSRPGPRGEVLEVRILAARGLKDTDGGFFGNVSDPYVAVRLGKEERRTPTVKNTLDPTWETKNEFSLPVTQLDKLLHLEVMNANMVSDDSLGQVDVALWSLAPGKSYRRREQLQGKVGHKPAHGELEFEVRLDDPTTDVDAQAASPVARQEELASQALPRITSQAPPPLGSTASSALDQSAKALHNDSVQLEGSDESVGDLRRELDSLYGELHRRMGVDSPDRATSSLPPPSTATLAPPPSAILGSSRPPASGPLKEPPPHEVATVKL